VLLASRAQEADSGVRTIGEARKVKSSQGLVQRWAVRWLAPAALTAGSVAHWITPEAFKPVLTRGFFLRLCLWTKSAALTNWRHSRRWVTPAQALAPT